MSLPAVLRAASNPSANPPSDTLRALAARGVSQTYRKGAVLITEGDVGDTIFINLAGKLRAFSAGPDDREVTYGHYGPWEYVGEIGLDGSPRSANVEAVEKTTVAVITRPTLQQHLREDPAFAFEMMNKLIFRVRVLTQRTRNMAPNDSYGRLSNLLNGMAAKQPDGTRLTLEPMTHAQLSEFIGCSRGMVTRLLNDLMRGGCLVQEKHCYRLRRALPPKW